MNLKCIGGPCDGKLVGVSSDYKRRLGDVIKVQIYDKSIEDFNPSVNVATIVTADFYYYKIDCLKYRAQGMVDPYELWFLRYDKLTTWEAIQHQFNK